ncbi:embryo defective 2016 [Euphorbia peplus]|nr:embryo defective 2016 [Euphorbia peplus]
MGRPEPCVLFSQTFVHPQLDEYVDEVLFAEPVVIIACEFLEQNASSISQVVPLVGATLPPSFALEVFVQCEGETRFRRLCQPFLYSHSSSNVLEVEAVVTNHLVVRGSYRSLSLIIYGNTAEDLGQFNIEFDDNSLTNLVSSAEGGLEDLPLALRPTNRRVEESLSSLNVLSLPVAASDISVEVKQFLQLILKMLGLPNLEDSVYKVVGALVAAVCSYVSHDLCCVGTEQKQCKFGGSKEFEQMRCAINDAGTQLLEVLRHSSEDGAAELLADCTFESHADLPTSKQLVDMLIQLVSFRSNSTNVKTHQLSESKNITLGLGLALLLCSGRESCFHFVNSGGLEQLADVFSCDIHDSSALVLLFLGVIEQATRHPIGCEGILGWWPREDENIPSGISKGYSQLLKLLLKKPSHDIASLATCVLHRLRFYEVASRYECAVLSVLGSLSAVGRFTNLTSNMLNTVKSQLKRLLKLINSHGPVEDPSPVACASRSLILGQTEGLLSYKATSGLISSSNCCFAKWDVDLHLLGLLKERGFLPLSAALLSSPILRSKAGHMMDLFIDIASTIGAILLSLLMSRSGLIFLSHYPELSTTLIDALRGGDMNKEDCVPLRYASVLMSKGFVCSPREVGIIVEMHLRVVNAIDRLVASTPHSEEFLWVLWELCGLSRSDCGRQALLVLGYFPEAVSILIEALHLVKESEPVSKNNGASPINLAIFHSASEIFEIIVNDSTASSLGSWIGHAMDLHKALHSSSPGSNRKDAPTRLLEWIDTGVVYHKNGAIGLLRYSAVLASGGDAHLTSTNILVSDLTDVESVIGDASGSGDINVMDNLGKIVSEKGFDGVALRDSSIAQLTTAIRILAFVSENSTVAAALYDEGAITVIYAVLVNCSSMLERSSNNYDYLVDEGAECNSTSDLLLERNREQSLVDLLVPSLVLLTILLQKLQEAKEQHRNTKLMNALLRLHREVSPKLAACAADLSSSYPDSALGFGAVCHLVVSALTFWPVYGWTPGLFHSLLSSVQVTSVMALGPKETCSFLCLLIDLFPEEGIWLWKNGMPLLSALRTLAVGTILGPLKERQVNWYLESLHLEKLLSQLTPHLDKIAQIIQHYAISGLVVIRDMLRVFIVRIACQRVGNASKLVRPILSSIHDHILDPSSPSDVDAYKVYRYLDFIASILEHPRAKMLLLEEGLLQVLFKVLDKCFGVIDSDGKQLLDGKNLANYGLTSISWSLPVFKCFLLLLGSETSLLYPGRHDLSGSLSNRDISLILPYLLRFCQVLPVGRELLSCLTCFKELGSSNEGRNALVSLLHQVNTSIEELGPERDENYNVDDFEWKKHPLLHCWKTLMKSIDTEDDLSAVAVEAVNELSIGSLYFCMDGKSLNLEAVAAIKYLFGLHDNADGSDVSQNITFVEEMIELLNSKTLSDDCLEIPEMRATLYQASESAGSLLLLLEKPTSSVTLDQLLCIQGASLGPNNVTVSMKTNQTSDISAGKLDDFGDLGEKFLWECPETLPDKSIPGKRKLSSLDGAAKRAKGENSVADITSQSAFSRTLGPSTASSGPTRRDTFRQRKPNTSRPPSMHVDDYVARERNVDGSTNSNVISVPRLGSTSGRPPSIHVDEFMARQRERQNPTTAAVVAEPSTQLKDASPVGDADKEKVDKSKQLKSDLDDELQGIDIVFDEESESDDKLPFPQPDDNLPLPAPVIGEQSSPHSIVEETESEVNESGQFPRTGTPLASNNDDITQSEYSSRMSVSRPEMPLTREPSVSSDKKFFEHSDELNNNIPVKTSVGFDSVGPASTSGFPSSFYNKAQVRMDSRMNPQNMYPKNSPQHASGSRGFYDQKATMNQPPLPPMPPPSTISPLMSQTPDSVPVQSSPFTNSLTDMHPLHPPGFHAQSDYMSTFGNSPASSVPMADSKYSRASVSSPSGSTGPHPPLPPTPPPFSSSPYNNLPSLKASTSQSPAYNVGTSEFSQSSIPMLDPRYGNLSTSGGLSSYMPPPLMPPMVFNRPVTIPYAPTQQHGENLGILQNMAIPQTIHQLQPLQPPLQRPAQPPQHLWPSVQPHQLEQAGVSLQNPIQMHQLQVLQQPQVSPMHGHYPSQQQEASQSRQQQQQMQVEHVPPQHQHQPELGMSLHEYFQDPEAITSLLGNKEELCRLLEQNPKLMQMLQEKLGQQ